ncbi:uncharacterized protein LOC141690930 [Apium graveolens]|uniref:uncharacterized protein LOC141690930 n=1 Tax=Apium graveolens TaxID=4045 RepID=UPI003D798E0D
MVSVLSPIPFAIWAIVFVGILPTSTRHAKYCIIIINYMTKWVEAKPLSAITEEVARKFFLEQIILRFRIPKKFSSVSHLQGNGAVEAANKVIFQGIKKRLGEAKRRWAEELPWVLWACRTTPRSSIRETPFRLAYGTDALVPVEVGLETYRTEIYEVEVNHFSIRARVDLLEEEREAAHQNNIKYLLQAAQYYNFGIKKRPFGIGDFVLREIYASIPMKQGKLQPNWEDPIK